MSSNRQYYMLLGSNMGNSRLNLYEATVLLTLYVGRISRISSLYSTAPWGEYDQSDFLNQAIIIESTFTPQEVLRRCQSIEKSLGKNKMTPYGARTIDIDIILIDDMCVDEEHLTVPHPKMCERNFVLIPLAQIAPEAIHPINGRSIEQLKDECEDTGEVTILE